ncbi:VAMP-associated protein [Coprinopsis marcescibilis]|uniref:VAMP-associated protein n=1 Tax=Coprinopsis marcescibilis TaxID=230819 RepID=A0A5C3L5K5_COPMA|nr:VAMP-associated protein [Coprinopsis marcescibilis]
MSVSLNPPNTLGFRRPLTQLVKRSLTITNNNVNPIAFKVKTTAPKLYCVRPNSGRVEPGESLEVAVMLQALKEEPPLNTKCKDKFLIQSTVITQDKETMSLQDIWASTDANEEGKVYQQKLRVAFLPAEGQTLEEEDETAHNQSSILNQSDNFDTVRQPPVANGHQAIPTFAAPPPLEEPRRPSTPPPADFSVAREASQDPQPQQHQPSYDIPVVNEPVHRAPTPPPAVQPPSPAVTVITKENPINQQLYAENNELRSEIGRLKDEYARRLAEQQQENELRQRRRRSSDNLSNAETDIQTAVDEPLTQPDGVPLNVVIVIAFSVFFMTYIFF